MGYDIGPRIGIDGEKEFRNSINGIITEMKTLGTEMRLVTSEFEDNADSQEALTQKNEVLNKQIDAQKRKLDLLQEGLRKCKEVYGETDVKTMKWQQSVNQAKTDLNKFETELRNNTQRLEELESGLSGTSDDLEETGKSAEKAADGFTVMKGALADLAADGIEKIGSGLKDMATQYTDASVKLQGQTGATTAEMAQYKDIMDDIYAGGYGDSLEGVADALAKVKQQAGDIDPSELEQLTKNALNLEQTFGFDVTESIRTAQQLMKQFGISGEEAFDLIVAGAQNGLNQNDNLLDTFNEYSPKFAAIGYDAKDMYNALRAGAKKGIFDMDKLGDAVNEFSIRVVDGSDTTKDAFEKIGLDADEMAEQFAAGGDTAKEAFKKTLEALESVEDPIDRNTAGVELFGTMWEDTGGEALLALDDIDGGIDEVTGSMQKLDEVNADNLSNKLEALGRKVTQEIAYPILEDALPAIESFVEYTAENLDELIPIAEGAAAAMTTIFLVDKAGEFAKSIKNARDEIKGLGDAAKKTNETVNTSIGSTNIVVAGLEVAVTTAMIAFSKWADDTNERIERLKEGSLEGLKGMQEGANGWTESLQGATGYLDQFNSELFASSEEQANLTTNMQEVQNGITTICKTATEERRGYTQGEIEQLNQYFQKLNELQEQQYQIEVQKMDAISQAAITYAQTQDTTFAEYQENASNWIATAEQQKEAMTALIDEQTVQEIALLNQRYGDEANLSNQAYANEYNAIIASGEQNKQAVEQNMANVYGAFANGFDNVTDQFGIFKVATSNNLMSIQTEMYTHANVMETIGQQYVQGTKEYQEAIEAENSRYEQSMGETWSSLIYQMSDAQGAQLASWIQMVADAQMHGAELDSDTQEMVNSLVSTFDSLPDDTKETMKNVITPMLEELKNSNPDLYEASKGDADSVINALLEAFDIHSPSKVIKEIFEYVGQGAIEGMDAKRGEVTETAEGLADDAIEALQGAGLYDTASGIGTNFTQGFIDGTNSMPVTGTAEGIAGDAIEALRSAGLYDAASDVGAYFTQGFIDGANSVSVTGAAAGIARAALNAMRSELDEHSPSKEAREIGEYFSEGFALGMEKERDKAIKIAETLAGDSLEALASEKLDLALMSEFDTKFQSRMESAVEMMREAFELPDFSVYENLSIDYGKLESIIRKAAGRGLYLDRRQLGRTLDEMGYMRR